VPLIDGLRDHEASRALATALAPGRSEGLEVQVDDSSTYVYFVLLPGTLGIVSYRIFRPGRTTQRTNSGTGYQQQSRAALV